MNREIKFRAWDIKENRWINHFHLRFNPMGMAMILVTNDLYYKEQRNMKGFTKTPDLTEFGLVVDKKNDEGMKPRIVLVQYTGLKDMNGKEIYEGDVVRQGPVHRTSEVFFRNGSFSTFLEPGQWLELSQNRFANQLEILGNKFENPELLNET